MLGTGPSLLFLGVSTLMVIFLRSPADHVGVRSPRTPIAGCAHPGASSVSSRFAHHQSGSAFPRRQWQIHRHFLGVHQQVMVTSVFRWLSIRQHQASWANAHAFQAKNDANGAAQSCHFSASGFPLSPLWERLRGILLSSAQVNCASKRPPGRSIISVSS